MAQPQQKKKQVQSWERKDGDDPDFQPQKPREFSVFEVSTYQTDGWEPFLPDNPLKDTAFEPLAKGFEHRRRRLDEARSSTTVGQADEELFRMVSKRTARALARDGLTADTSELGALSRGIVLVDEANKKYLTSNKHEVTDQDIKRFLKAEARRMWSKKGQSDAEVQSILLADAHREFEEAAGDDSSDEDEDYRAILRLLEKLHELPKVVDTIVQMTGSGMTAFLSADDVQKSKAFGAFKLAVSRVASLTPAEVGIVSMANMSSMQGGVVIERVQINFQIVVIDRGLVGHLESSIRDSIHDGSLGNHLTHAGIQAIVMLRSGPRVFVYGADHFDLTQKSLGEPAKALKARIHDADLVTKGIKPGKEWVSEVAEAGKDSEEQSGQILINLAAEDFEEALRRQKLRKRRQRRKKTFGLADTGDGLVPLRPPTGKHGLTLERRPATSMGRVESIVEEQRSIMLRNMELSQTEKARERRSKTSLAVAVDAWSPSVTDDLESWAESRQKMAGYFANVASRKRSAAAGQVSDAVAAAKEQVVRKNAAIKQEAHQIREAELAKYAADRKKSRKEASAFVPPGKLECVPPGKLERLGPTLGDSERVRSAKPHKINLGSNGQGGLGLQNNSRPSTSSSWSRQDTHGTSSRPNSRGSVDIATKMTKSSKTRTRIGGGGSGVVPHRREVTSNKHVGQIMDAGAWEQIDGSHEGELGFFQQKLRQAQVQAYAGDANGGRLDGNAAFNWQSETGAQRVSPADDAKNLDCRWCKNRRNISLEWARTALKVLWNDKAVKELEKDVEMIDCPFCVGLDGRIRRGFLRLNRPILSVTNTWVAPSFAPDLDSEQMRRVGGEEAWADETSFNKSPDVVCGVCPGPEYGALVTMTAGGIVVEAEVQTGRVLERCKAPGKAVANCICMHGNNLYAGMDDGRIREYVCGGVEDGGFQRCMFARQKSILCVSVSSDGSVLASGSIDNTTMIWNTATGQVMRHICAVTPSFPDIVQKKTAEYDVDAPCIAYAFRHHRGAVSAVVAIKAAVITGSWDSTICIAYLPVYRERWNDTRAIEILKERCLELSTQVETILEEHAPRRPVGRALRHMEKLEEELNVCAHEQTKREQRMRNSLFRCRKFLRVGGRDVGKVLCIAFQKLEGGTYGLFAGYSDGNVRQWDVNGSKVACVVMAHQGSSVTSVTMGVGRLYTGGAEGKIKVWDLGTMTKEVTRTQRNLLDVLGHSDGVSSLRICGNVLLSASLDLTVRAWDMLACDPKMKPNNFPETSLEAPKAMRLYNRDEVMFMEEEEERAKRFENVDNATKNLLGTVLTTVGLKRASRKARRSIRGDHGPDIGEDSEEEELDEGAEFQRMVHHDMLELTEMMPSLSVAVKEGTDLAEEFLRNLRTKIRGGEDQ